jgi:hypothetical protein
MPCSICAGGARPPCWRRANPGKRFLAKCTSSRGEVQTTPPTSLPVHHPGDRLATSGPMIGSARFRARRPGAWPRGGAGPLRRCGPSSASRMDAVQNRANRLARESARGSRWRSAAKKKPVVAHGRYERLRAFGERRRAERPRGTRSSSGTPRAERNTVARASPGTRPAPPAMQQGFPGREEVGGTQERPPSPLDPRPATACGSARVRRTRLARPDSSSPPSRKEQMQARLRPRQPGMKPRASRVGHDSRGARNW